MRLKNTVGKSFFNQCESAEKFKRILLICLFSLMRELQNNSNRQFWEVSERETNFTYMNNEKKLMLPGKHNINCNSTAFFNWLKNFKSENSSEDFDVVERRKLERQQQLFNFE